MMMDTKYFGPISGIVDEASKTITLQLKRQGPRSTRLTDNALSSIVSWAVGEYSELLESGFYMDFSEVEHLVDPSDTPFFSNI